MNRENNTPVYTISQINQQIRYFLEENIAPLWLVGEVSNFACPSSGHWYFSLKDEKASLRCAFFKPVARGCKTPLENGTKVQVHGTVSLYEARGEYQFIVDYVEPVGDGLLQRAFEKLKQQLLQEGLFDERYKKTLPVFPETVGVITSSTGAAFHDILHVLEKRFPLIKIILYPASVQGFQSVKEIIEAIEIANQRKECDVLIVGRGGGSLEDLQSFNEESVARAIFKSEIPIVSAVGHEIDFTIADFVADVRAPTPSAAAALVSPDREALLQQLRLLEDRLMLRHPVHQLQENQQKLDTLEVLFHRVVARIISEKQQSLAQLIRALNTLNPLSTLERGYAVVYKLEKLKTQSRKIWITDIEQICLDEKITVQLKNGEIECRVGGVSKTPIGNCFSKGD